MPGQPGCIGEQGRCRPATPAARPLQPARSELVAGVAGDRPSPQQERGRPELVAGVAAIRPLLQPERPGVAASGRAAPEPGPPWPQKPPSTSSWPADSGRSWPPGGGRPEPPCSAASTGASSILRSISTSASTCSLARCSTASSSAGPTSISTSSGRQSTSSCGASRPHPARPDVCPYRPPRVVGTPLASGAATTTAAQALAGHLDTAVVILLSSSSATCGSAPSPTVSCTSF